MIISRQVVLVKNAGCTRQNGPDADGPGTGTGPGPGGALKLPQHMRLIDW